jgi:hypothetical protein
MANSTIRKTESAPLGACSDADERLRSWMRERERLGALGETEAALEGALAHGYAQGLEVARSEALDDKRTLLLTMLETKFGDIDDATLDAIEATAPCHLDRWFLGLLGASSLAEVLESIKTAPSAKRTA